MINFKQMVGLIVLSVGIILTIYACREEGTTELALYSGIALLLSGTVGALVYNK